MLHPVRVGCSGWQYADWKEGFYGGLPQRRWLAAYASRFDTVEVNSTFYRLAKPGAVAAWVEETPPEFVFAAKGSRYITHMKRFRDLAPALGRYYAGIAPLVDSGKLGPVVWQLPERFHRDEERLSSALVELPPGLHCFEFRHPSWFVGEVMDLLRTFGVALVLGDDARRPLPESTLTADWTLVRFHFGARGRRGNYSESELDEWAMRIHEWRRSVAVYAYFNNDWEEFAPRNASGMLRRLANLEAAEALRGDL
jgi:uncharacterized protein YecE (DUF72 family)